MYCQQCGAEVEEDSNFCRECGYQVKDKGSRVKKEDKGQEKNEAATKTTPETPKVSGSEPQRQSNSGRDYISSDKVSYAGFWKRLGAVVIDSLILAPVFFVLQALITPGGFFNQRAALRSGDIMTYFGFLLFVPPLLGWLYYAYFESSSVQQTPGKSVLGLKVVDYQGKKISFFRASARYFSKTFSSLIFGIGFLMAGLTSRKQALHDLIAGTLIVEDSSTGASTSSSEAEESKSKKVIQAENPAVESVVYFILAVIFSLFVFKQSMIFVSILFIVLYLAVIRVGLLPGIGISILVPASLYLQEAGFTVSIPAVIMHFGRNGFAFLLLTVVVYLLIGKINKFVSIIIGSVLFSLVSYFIHSIYLSQFYQINRSFVFAEYLKYELLPPLAGGLLALLIYNGIKKYMTS